MIRHIVFFTAKDETQIDQIIEGLLVRTAIPHARRIEVARNRKTDQLGNDIDVVIYGEFDNEMELARYKAHALYQESIRRVRPLREMCLAADYDLSIDAHFKEARSVRPLVRLLAIWITCGGKWLGRLLIAEGNKSMYVWEVEWIEPVTAMLRLGHRAHLTFLDSAASDDLLGQYSYLACDPFGSYCVADGEVRWNGEPIGLDPWEVLRKLLADYPQEHRSDLPPFQGGAAGFFGYDLNRTLERLPFPTFAGLGLPQSMLLFYDVVVSFDHRDTRCWIVSSGWPEQHPAGRDNRARRRAQEFADLLATPAPSLNGSSGTAATWDLHFSREGYVATVKRVIELILSGDVFQDNIAQRFSARLPPAFDPLAFYCWLRSSNPAPFSALLRYGEISIASSSPERFLKLDKGQVETRPIKGTIARSADPREDQKRAEMLFMSKKDRAENVMIVDLLRNDLSRVCTAESISVPELCSLESYASTTSSRLLRVNLQPSPCFAPAFRAARSPARQNCVQWKSLRKWRVLLERSTAERSALSDSAAGWIRALRSAPSSSKMIWLSSMRVAV